MKGGRKKGGMTGELNPRWNGGISEYSNHYELKKARIEVLKRTHGKCEICGEPAKIVHHIDGFKDNHNLNNLIPLCKNCHAPLHANDETGKYIDSRHSKYIKLYGYTLRELAQIFNEKNEYYIWYYIKNNKDLFESKLKEYKNNLKMECINEPC